MNYAITQRPSVPSSPTIPGHGGGYGNGGVEGAKNSWKRSGHQPSTLTLACYNVRTLRTDERLHELELETQKIKWDFIGLSEVRRNGEDLIKLNSGNLLYYRGYDDSSYGGVGFLIIGNLASLIQEVKSISTCVCFLTIYFNKRYSLKVIKVYAPSSSYTDEEIEVFYEEVENDLKDKPCMPFQHNFRRL